MTSEPEPFTFFEQARQARQARQHMQALADARAFFQQTQQIRQYMQALGDVQVFFQQAQQIRQYIPPMGDVRAFIEQARQARVMSFSTRVFTDCLVTISEQPVATAEAVELTEDSAPPPSKTQKRPTITVSQRNYLITVAVWF